MNVYLLSGKDIFRIESSLNDLLKKNGIDRDHTVSFDGSDKKNFHIENAVMECDMFSLFDAEDKKAVIVKNPFFLNASVKETEKITKADSAGVRSRKEKELKAKENRFQVIETYLKNQNANSMLVFFCCGYDADSRKKEYKLFQKHDVQILNFAQMNDREFDAYAGGQLKKAGYHLANDAKKELYERVGTDTLQLHNAIEKMDLYGQKELDLNDIKHIVPMNPDVNAFKMSSLFLQGDLAGTLSAKDEMLTAGYDYNALIALIGSKIRSLYNMKMLYERGLDEDTVAVRLHANKWAVHFSLQDSRRLNSTELLKYLNELASLDQGIKNGTINPKEGFESFLLRNGNHTYAGNQRAL